MRINSNLKSLVFMCITFLSCTTFAQQKAVFNESFANNRNNWESYSNRNNVRFSNGLMHLKNNSDRSYETFVINLFADTKKDFKLTTKFICYGRKSEIFWGAQNWANTYSIAINSNKTIQIGETRDKVDLNWNKYLRNESIKGSGNSNEVVVEKTGNQIKFYVNGQFIYEHKFKQFFGNVFGFHVKPNTKIEVQKFKLEYTKLEINEVSEESIPSEREFLSSNVNSAKNEIAPIPSADGNTLYFCRRTVGSGDAIFSECDIWKTTRNEKDEWSKPIRLKKPINNNDWNTPVAISQDGNALVVEGQYRSDGSKLSNQGISISKRVSSGWSVPKAIKIDKFYNKSKFFVFTLSPDQNVLIMAVLRDDTEGNFDLFVSFRKSDGSYGPPKNMGSVLNTFAHESSPFIAPDNKTLYFSSDGHPGYGGTDIFVSKRLDDTWTNWSPPKNLGKKVNSKNGESYFSVSGKGEYAFLISNERGAKTKEQNVAVDDIYRIKLADEAKPEAVAIINGKIVDPGTGRPIEAKIIYQDAETFEMIGEASSDPNTGEYSLALPLGKKYNITARASGHKFIKTQNVDLVNTSEYKEIKMDLEMTSISEGSTFELHSIGFLQNKVELLETSFLELNELVQMMSDNKEMKIFLSGHTETAGNRKHLQELSEGRVETVRKYLMENGVSGRRIEGKGYGASKPLGRGTKEIEQKNRRVEVKIVAI